MKAFPMMRNARFASQCTRDKSALDRACGNELGHGWREASERDFL
jgi:hypothetical protein